MPIWKNKDGTWANDTGARFRDGFPSYKAAVDWELHGDPEEKPLASIPPTVIRRTASPTTED